MSNTLIPRRSAMTRIDILVLCLCFAGIGLLVTVLTGQRVAHWRRTGPLLQYCTANLKHIGLSLNNWSTDHNGQLPWNVPISNGGSMELLAAGVAAPHFKCMANELSTPKVLACPADERPPANDFLTLTDQNIGYFLNLDGQLGSSNSVLAGDRNLLMSNQPVKPGLVAIGSVVVLDWTSDLHSRKQTNRCGNVLFGDGHVETIWKTLTATQHTIGPKIRLVVP